MQQLDGDVASYHGARVIGLKGITLSTLDVPLTKAVYQHVEAKDLKQAYAVACLGVTQVNIRLEVGNHCPEYRIYSYVVFLIDPKVIRCGDVAIQ